MIFFKKAPIQTSAIALAACIFTSFPAFSQNIDINTNVESSIEDQAVVLAGELKVALEGAETEESAVAIVAELTNGISLEIVLAALQILAEDDTITNAPVKAAISSALEIARIAVTAAGGTGDIAAGAPPNEAIAGNIASSTPGGGGGSDYQ